MKFPDTEEELAVQRVVGDWAITLFMIMVMAVLLMSWDTNKKQDAVDQSQGNLAIILQWEPRRNIDLDLWVVDQAGNKVGYSSLSSPYCNLLRDDLGNVEADASEGQNIEVTYCRGLEPGDRLRVTVHVYADKEGGTAAGSPLVRPVKARVRLMFSPTFSGKKRLVFDVSFVARGVGLEYGIAEVVFDKCGAELCVKDVIPAPESIITDQAIPVGGI